MDVRFTASDIISHNAKIYVISRYILFHRSGDYKLIVGSPGRYNNWYQAKTKPACNSKEARQGYMYEERQLKLAEKLDRQEQKSVNGWWFTSPLQYIKGRYS
jgi:hypothetical protein